jgi:cell volume regulation protein A
MATLEPLPTAWLLAITGILLAVSAVLSRASSRIGVPAVLVFMLVGMLAGSEGPGGIFFEDYALSLRLGMVALAFILFDGGLNTSVRTLRSVLLPAATLATVGVLVTALLLAVGARILGFGWTEALLLGAVASSTDAAAVFSVLRGSGWNVRRRIAATLEVESGLNDPIAVVLTVTLVALGTGRFHGIGEAVLHAFQQLLLGAVGGLAAGFVGRWLISRVRLGADGLYPVLSLATAMFAFGATTLASGSGFLAVYVAGVVLGHGSLPHRSGLVRVHDSLAWMSQILMFLTLGLLVFPSRVMAVAPVGLTLALWLIFIARPLAVIACLAPFRYPWSHQLYIGWVGLRGAIPIVLAMFPVLAELPGSRHVFDVVFFVVVVSVLVQGTTAPWLTRRFRLGGPMTPSPPAFLDISTRRPLGAEPQSFFIRPDAAVAGAEVGHIPLPEGAAVLFVIRDRRLLPAPTDLVIEPGDHVYVVVPPAERGHVQLLFGTREES